MSDSVRHRQQPTSLPRPWDSSGKNTGVGCHFLLQCMKVKSESEVTQLCLALSYPIHCSLPGSSIHGIFQARVLEWGAIAFSAVIIEPKKIKSVTVSIVSPSICHEVIVKLNWQALFAVLPSWHSAHAQFSRLSIS